MEPAKDALAAMGMDLNEVLEIDSVLRTRPAKRDGRICLCGHGLSKHQDLGGYILCKPSKMDCPCKKIRAVIDTDDTRPFLRRTSGAGPLHALSRGLAALAQSGRVPNGLLSWSATSAANTAIRSSPFLLRKTATLPTSQQGMIYFYAKPVERVCNVRRTIFGRQVFRENSDFHHQLTTDGQEGSPRQHQGSPDAISS
jgi:hypothetical protein